MERLDLTLPDAAANLALDEALLQQAEHSGAAMEVLRLWESPQVAVVVGRASRIEAEVDLEACRRRDVPILRRDSGGTAVVIGPGCLMYGVVLSYGRRARLRMIDQAHRFVLGAIGRALGTLASGVEHLGTSDLALGPQAAAEQSAPKPPRKFSGNSLRCKQTHLLYHGTILYDFPLALIDACLKSPPREPDYRGGRRHGDFLTNFPAPAEAIRRALAGAWKAHEPLVDWPEAATRDLVRQKYSRKRWNFAR